MSSESVEQHFNIVTKILYNNKMTWSGIKMPKCHPDMCVIKWFFIYRVCIRRILICIRSSSNPSFTLIHVYGRLGRVRPIGG